MSQRKRLSRTPNTPSVRRSGASLSQEEDDDLSFTMPSTSQVQRGLEKLTPIEVDRKTAEVVKYFLMKDQKKIPIRRADIFKHVLKDYKNILPEIMKRVVQTFDQIFGLKVVEIDSKNHVYILVNKLASAEGAPPVSPSSPKLGLLFVILSVIFMKGGVVRENMIWNILKKLHADPGKRHEEFGDVKRVVTDEFVRQRYLEYTRIAHTDPVEHEFRWGQRATAEVSQTKILDFMGELHDRDPKSWTQQYREAQSTPGPEANTNSQR
ncbi:necdin-like 2 isoform X2 [Brachionichthys hirsutus]|uniref:necdin-like 2 isoform X2 n=1 Tax=Brachionichthys hirsutus TaxID=412623 RepID=UPI00360487B1